MFWNDLSAKQLNFLREYHDSPKSVKILYEDYGLTPEEFVGWHRQGAFRKKLTLIMRSHTFLREMEIRKAGKEAAFRYGSWASGVLKFLSPKHRQIAKDVLELARKLDSKFPSLIMSTRKNVAPHINPIHPAFRDEADRLMDEMEAIRKAAAAGQIARGDDDESDDASHLD